MVEFPHTFPAVVAVFGSIFSPAVTDETEVLLGPLVQKELVLFWGGRLEAWVFASGDHEVSVGSE